MIKFFSSFWRMCCSWQYPWPVKFQHGKKHYNASGILYHD